MARARPIRRGEVCLEAVGAWPEALARTAVNAATRKLAGRANPVKCGLGG